MNYLGDYLPGDTVRFMWPTNGADGAAIVRSTDGTVSVYKDASDTQTTTGVTDTESADGVVGVNRCLIATTDSFYTINTDFHVVLSGATIDTKSVATPIAHFSILNRFPGKLAVPGTVDNTAFTATAIELEADDITSATASTYVGRDLILTSGTYAKSRATITAYVLTSGRGHFTYSTLPGIPADNTTFIIL